MTSARQWRRLFALTATGVVASAGCDRETRRFRELPPAVTASGAVSTGEPLQPGVPSPDPEVVNVYETNAYAISEGKRLYESWNCVGCHSHGGGGMGPPLMDAEWIYGADPENIVATIIEGRPNGMPSFRNRISNQQLWQIAAYVRSLSGLTPKAASSGRDDNMQVKRDEQRTPEQRPRPSSGQAPPAPPPRP